jgi:diguanylate cyclase (GGDEF)-like protein
MRGVIITLSGNKGPSLKPQMTGRKVAHKSAILQEKPEDAPRGWAPLQQSIAEHSGLSLLLVEGHQPPALAIANNNSICEALQSSPEHVKLCDPFCGVAHLRATAENAVVHYRCHAGLQCFAIPVAITHERKLVVIGGRAFASGSDYCEFVERVRSGDLQELASDELFQNVIFAEEGALDHAALKVTRAAHDFVEEPLGEVERVTKEDTGVKPKDSLPVPERRVESEAHFGLDRRAPFANSIRRFAEQIDASEPSRIYESILAQSSDLLKAERSSLFLFDETTNELTMKASRGLPVASTEVSSIRMGEGIAGSVFSEGNPLVTTIDALGRIALSERRYKTNSFLSYPIAIGARKIGLLNMADKIGGGAYDESDLNIIDLVAPQIALALERAVWQHRANQFQLMSITDPLTGLHNRRYMEVRLTEELNRSKRYDQPMSFMMIDIDDFKQYNDRNGHQAGDRALEIMAQCLRSTLRKVDVASRYGGEEFSILLPQATLKEAGAIADRLRRKIMATKFPHGESQPLGAVTVSIGLAAVSASLDTAEAIIRAADRALYHAKSHGKNRAYAYQGASQ